MGGWLRYFFSFRGRLNRARWWLLIPILFVFYVLFDLLVRFGAQSALPDYVAFAIIWPSILLPLWAIAAIGVKRLHDCNKEGWWLLIYYGLPIGFSTAASTVDPRVDELMRYGPFLLTRLHGAGAWLTLGYLVSAWWALFELGGVRGTRGENRFGPDPLPPVA